DGLAVLPLAVPDSDGDLVADFRDADADNDGIPDLIESAGEAADSDGDGMIDGFVDSDGDGRDDAYAVAPLEFLDTDADGQADHLDLDADNDGVTDLAEAGGLDVDGDGQVDGMADADGDGIPDTVDVDQTGGADSDGDGIDDTADADFVEAEDSDGDGIVDAMDPDADGDGFAELDDAPDLGASLPDSDGNGVPDYQQAESELIRTGLEGGGCTLSSVPGAPDPTLPLTAVLAAGWLSWRRWFSRKAGTARRER
ncbi:JDVT-CTERM domain-containing protein, partial [Granulosicoccaceae sp. 1_MG-2023]|nr:JDVT-CTERM domain-containing protein [Granulosicoccaceae sp. 1_MG-2023]